MTDTPSHAQLRAEKLEESVHQLQLRIADPKTSAREVEECEQKIHALRRTQAAVPRP